jgi:hypothetical protein
MKTTFGWFLICPALSRMIAQLYISYISPAVDIATSPAKVF